MDFSALYASAWRRRHNLVDVTLLYAEGGVQKEAAVEDAWKGAEEKREVATGPALLEATYCRFHLWREKLGGVTPTKGHKVREADGTVWHVEAAQEQMKGQRYRLECRRDR